MYAHVKLLHAIRVVIFVSREIVSVSTRSCFLRGVAGVVSERDKILADSDFGFSNAPVGVP